MNRSRESGWGISQATISGIENDRVRLGVERARVLATAAGFLTNPSFGSNAAHRQRQASQGEAAAGSVKEARALWRRAGPQSGINQIWSRNERVRDLRRRDS